MSDFVFYDLDFPKTVWREGDPPLVNGSGPVIEPAEPPAQHDHRLLLWIGVIACIGIGAQLVALLVRLICYTPSPPMGEGVIFRTPLITAAVAIWLIICLLAIVRAWRKSQS